MSDRTNVLFVYGTLKQGECRGPIFNQWMKDDMFKVVPATTKADLYDLGPYPAILPGDNTVYGEAIVLKDNRLMQELIPTLDMIEGYSGRPDHPGNLYVRKVVEVTLASGEKVRAVTYFFANEEVLKQQAVLVESGVWSESI